MLRAVLLFSKAIGLCGVIQGIVKTRRDQRADSAVTEPGGGAKRRVKNREPRKAREKSPLPKQPIRRNGGGLEPACACFPRFLQLLLGLKGWSAAELSWITGLDESYLRDLGNHQAGNPTLNVISLVARAFGIELRCFMDQMLRCRGMEAGVEPNVGLSQQVLQTDKNVPEAMSAEANQQRGEWAVRRQWARNQSGEARLPA